MKAFFICTWQNISHGNGTSLTVTDSEFISLFCHYSSEQIFGCAFKYFNDGDQSLIVFIYVPLLAGICKVNLFYDSLCATHLTIVSDLCDLEQKISQK